MVAAFDYCLHGTGGAAPSIDTAMHGLVDAGARRPPAPRLRHRARDRRRRRGADPRVLRRPGGLGAVAAARLPARPRHRRDPARPTRRRSASSSAATASPPGARPARSARRNSLEIIRHRASGSSPSTGGPSRSAPWCPGTSRCRDAERRARAAALLPVLRGLASTDRPQVGHFTDSDVVLDFLAREKLAPARRARHLVPRPLPAHQGPPARRSTCRRRAARGRRRPAARAARRLPRGLRAPTTSATPTPDIAADARRRPGDRARARRRHVLASGATSRPPGSPASSTSTRST